MQDAVGFGYGVPLLSIGPPSSLLSQVYMQPSGTLGLLGLQSQQLFLRDALEKLKVRKA